MRTLYGYWIVFLGAGLGGILRHSVNLVTRQLLGPDLPTSTMSTLLVNVLGALSVGVLAEHVALRGHGPHAVHLFFATGILGGFTTFSAFSLDAALLWERGQVASCILYVLTSVLFSIAGVFAGLALMRSWHAV